MATQAPGALSLTEGAGGGFVRRGQRWSQRGGASEWLPSPRWESVLTLWRPVLFSCRLRCHRDDPSLDDPIPQEYALFLCPTGSLLERLQEFWRESKRQCTRNRAHEVFPHITLCDFFTVSRPHVPQCSLTRHWGRSP